MKSEFNSRTATFAILLATILTLSACASGPQQTSTPYNSPNGSSSNSSPFGTIESIQAINTQATNNGGGAIVGGIVGAVLGNQVGGGTGRTVATVAGAVGGAVVGNNVQNRNAQGHTSYQILVRMDNGSNTSITQDNVADLGVGSRVRVVDGRAYRQ